MRKLISAKEAAERLKISICRVYQLIKNKKIPVFSRLNKIYLIDENKLNSLKKGSQGRPPNKLPEEMIIKITKQLNTLTELERRIVTQRLGLDGPRKTINKISELNEITKDYALRIYKRAIRKIKKLDG